MQILHTSSSNLFACEGVMVSAHVRLYSFACLLVAILVFIHSKHGSVGIAEKWALLKCNNEVDLYTLTSQ